VLFFYEEFKIYDVMNVLMEAAILF